MSVIKRSVIGITGPIGHGKSELARAIVRYVASIGKHAEVVGFAHAIKSLAYDKFGWDGRKDKKGRRLLQGIGNTGRAYFNNLWVAKWMHLVLNERSRTFIVADDVRFGHEAAMIHSMGGWVVHVVRVGHPCEGGDVTEEGINPDLVDQTIMVEPLEDVECAMFDLARQLVIKYVLDKGKVAAPSMVIRSGPPKE